MPGLCTVNVEDELKCQIKECGGDSATLENTNGNPEPVGSPSRAFNKGKYTLVQLMQ